MPSQPIPQGPKKRLSRAVSRHQLRGNPALVALVDAVSYARDAFGQDNDPRQHYRHVLLALAVAGAAAPVDLARTLRCERPSSGKKHGDGTYVRKELSAMEHATVPLVAKVDDPRDGRRRLYFLTPAGEHAARVEMAAALSRLGYAQHYSALATPPRPGHQRRLTRRAIAALPWPPKRIGPERTAARLVQLRSALGVSQAELARRAAMPLSAVRAMESGKKSQPVHQLYFCCRALGARLGDVVGT